ncbi:MAG: hypothetical protein ACOC32_01230 [Nanoarchaeota archaeon]
MDIGYGDHLTQNHDALIAEGMKIRAICDDLGKDITEHMALLEIHTVFTYDTDIRGFFREHKEIALKALDYLLAGLEGREHDPAYSEQQGAIESVVPGYMAQLRKLDAEASTISRLESLAEDVFATSRKLYADESFLDGHIGTYFSAILPRMDFYDEEQVEYSFERVREKESESQRSLLEQYGIKPEQAE